MTNNGGTVCSGCGTIFKIKNDGTAYSILHSFANTVDGKNPYGSLVSEGTFLYGMTTFGGTNDEGTIFKIKHDGTGYSKLQDLSSTSSFRPSGSLISDGTFLYGMSSEGGIYNKGTIFKYQIGQIGPICEAHYTTNYDSVQNNFTLLVNDTSTVNITTGYLWDFGDGLTSTLATPSHAYNNDTLYNVCMTKFRTSGDSCTYCHIIGLNALGNIVRNGGFTINVQNSNFSTNSSQNKNDESIIEIYPNPTDGIFQIVNIKNQEIQIEIYNVLGECISHYTRMFSNFQIDLSNQPNGIYFINIKTETGIVSKNIVVNK
jgi:uncharacterized repeat protein (TIGR03803 family)